MTSNDESGPFHDLHFEFIGSPGSGKSTIMKGVEWELQARSKWNTRQELLYRYMARSGGWVVPEAVLNIAPPRIRNRIFAISMRQPVAKRASKQFIVTHFEWISLMRKAIKSSSDNRLDRRLLESWINQLGAEYHLWQKYKRKGEMMIFDEGFIHRTLSSFVSSTLSHDTLYKCIDAAPRPDVLFVVTAPTEVCISRLDVRGWPRRLRECSAEMRTEHLNNYQRASSQVVRQLSRRGSLIHEVDNVSAQSQAVQQILGFIGDLA